MIVMKGCIKKTRTITGGSVTKIKSLPVTESQPSANAMNHDVPRAFLASHTVDSSLKSHDNPTNIVNYNDALHSFSFYPKRREKKEGVNLKI